MNSNQSVDADSPDIHGSGGFISSIEVIWIVSFFILGCGAIMHSLGIYAIIWSKKSSIQTIILLNLSMAEMIALINYTANDIYRFRMFDESIYLNEEKMRSLLINKLPAPYAELSFILAVCNVFQVIIIMGIMTADRLACVTVPILYKICAKKMVLIRLMIFCHIFSAIIGIVYGVVPASRKTILYFGVFLGIAYIVFACITFVIIYTKIRSWKQRRLSSSSMSSADVPTSWKFYIVSALIVTTFTFLYSIPYGINSIVIRYNYKSPLTRTKFLVHEGLYILVYIGILSDPVIYIFLRKEFRDVVFELFSYCRRSGGGSITPASSRDVVAFKETAL